MDLSTVCCDLDIIANEIECVMESLRVFEEAMTYGREKLSHKALHFTMNHFMALSRDLRENVDQLYVIMRGE